MAVPVSQKLSSSFEGALAGGGDPATSPLYVFTPFLRLIVVGAVAGVAHVTFGATMWLVVVTIVMVSAMYRLVMRWITDGSGGSGLAEEEFGQWAVKTNAAITYIEYTLTFLVSIAALVTFVADRFPALNETLFGSLQYRALLAVALSILTGWLVNRGPKATARFFGPATLGVLILLWIMVFVTIGQHVVAALTGSGLLAGVPLLPQFDLQAFSPAATAPGQPSYLTYTLGGYARILAVMTGIEVFANLVAAYQGPAEVKARRAFGSLVIIMGTTGATMLIVGPVIFALSDPANTEVSVFTQTMDLLLPGPLAYLGTLVGVAVLLSASAASSIGIQNLSLGLSTRRYVPPSIGRANRFGVADRPVWLEVAVCCLCFLTLGTSEVTYLAIYAAGVFILLSMTGFAAIRRLIRLLGEAEGRPPSLVLALIGSGAAAVLTAVATAIIFYERFTEGAWVFLVLIPLLYLAFSYFHSRLARGSTLEARLAEARRDTQPVQATADDEAQAAMREIEVAAGEPLPPLPTVPTIGLGGVRVDMSTLEWAPTPPPGAGWRAAPRHVRHVLVPLGGTPLAEAALGMAECLAAVESGRISLVSVLPTLDPDAVQASGRRAYLEGVAGVLAEDGFAVDIDLRAGKAASGILAAAGALRSDAIVMATHGRSQMAAFVLGSVSRELVQVATRPLVLVRPGPEGHGNAARPALRRVLVTLDGSAFAERVLPYAIGLARDHQAEIIALVVPEIPEAEVYGALAEVMAELREQAEALAEHYLRQVLAALAEDGIRARGLVGGNGAARAVIDQAEAVDADLVMLATHGRGGLSGLLLGSVAARVVDHIARPVFLLPIRERAGAAPSPQMGG